MKLTIINGCNHDHPLQKKVINYLEENEIGKLADWIDLKNVKHCMGCDYCQRVNPGICAINDGHNENLRQYMKSDTVMIITPVQFGCCHSIVKNFIDRTQPLFLPFQVSKNGKSVMKGRYDQYPELILIGVCDDENMDVAETFNRFINTCNLSAASDKVTTKIIRRDTDLASLKELML